MIHTFLLEPEPFLSLPDLLLPFPSELGFLPPRDPFLFIIPCLSILILEKKTYTFIKWQ